MSYWAVTVITSLLNIVPYIGFDILQWFWGGFSIANPTLNRFFSFHYLLPFIIVGLSLLHMIYLHEFASNNPLGLNLKVDIIFFSPYYIFKDMLILILFLFIYFLLIFFFPLILGHSDNFIEANSLVTPTHIVPEWYFLFFYAFLRSVHDKVFGLFLLIGSIFCLLFLPFFVKAIIRCSIYDIIFKFFILIILLDMICLCYLGGMPVVYPYVNFAQVGIFCYFVGFLFLWVICIFFNKTFLKKKYK